MKRVLGAALFLLVCTAPASADIFGVSVGATAGATNIKYDGHDDYGFEYGINAAYQINDMISVSAGVAQGSAEIDADGQSAKNDIDYTAFPITIRGDLPLLIGNVYAKAGTNYYDYDIEAPGIKGSDDGWGFTGGVGFVFTLLPLIDLSVGYEYRDMGDVTNNSILFGIGTSL